MDNKTIHAIVLRALEDGKGIIEVRPFNPQDREKILDIEKSVEDKGLMGLGRVVNTGLQDILSCDLIYVALTDMDFDWGCHPALVLIKDDEIVGEEVRDPDTLEKLSKDENAWFMHEHFVIYKGKINFPQDIMKRKCHFATPSIPAEWCVLEDGQFQCRSIRYANPVPPCDLYLKEQYFSGTDQQGLGTILVGVKL
jgi:hypothetical protein